MEIIPQNYLKDDSHFGTTLVEVPTACIVEHFRSENRLNELLSEGYDDHLEEFVVKMAESLHETLDIPFENLGIAGSILWKGHNPEFSDINMNIYGFEHSWLLQENYEEVAEENNHIRVRAASEWSNSISRILERIPVVTKEDLQLLFTRRKAFYYDEQCIGITPVLRPPNIPITHQNETYTSLSSSPTRLTMDIEIVEYGLFHPGLYEGHSKPIPELDGATVTRIWVYDGAFTGLLMSDDRVEVSGVIQRVVSKTEPDSEPFYQIMVGTKNGAGKEFIRLLP
jgi:predicted nucleotidyltransferase